MLILCMDWMATDKYCRNPPDDEALLATVTQLAHMMIRFDSLRGLDLRYAPSFIAQVILEKLTRLDYVQLEDYTPVTASIQSLFSLKSLRELSLYGLAFQNSESIDAFCQGMDASCLETLFLSNISFPPEHDEQAAQVASTLALCKTLVQFQYRDTKEENQSFCDQYCVALSNNVDTKLERLRIIIDPGHVLHVDGSVGNAIGAQASLEKAKIRNLLKWNSQRRTCPPLFAAIDKAETDNQRQQCLVDAFEAVDIPVLFEYTTANENNLIELIQRLGRSRKRQRED